MRIIGGKYRGKKLISPVSDKVRPTSDKAREALFNILRSRMGNDFGKLALIDVFAGSGAFGLEAISQGFASVCLVDIEPKDLLKNVALFSNEKNKINVIKADATQKLPLNEKFDVVFMDAPYHQNLSEKALEQLRDVLKTNALCLIEVCNDEVCNLPEGYKLIDERKYGIAKVLIAEFIC